jgi:uracil-DNA glycosylase
LWLGLARERFYDEALVATMPMSFCYPGRSRGGDDLPPRPECTPRWHPPLRAFLSDVALTLSIGGHEIRHYLAEGSRANDGRDDCPLARLSAR